MDDYWLKNRLERLWQRVAQIDSQLEEIDNLLEDNTETIQGFSIPLRQLTSSADRPTHAILRWNYTLSHADEILQLTGLEKLDELSSGDSI